MLMMMIKKKLNVGNVRSLYLSLKKCKVDGILCSAVGISAVALSKTQETVESMQYARSWRWPWQWIIPNLFRSSYTSDLGNYQRGSVSSELGSMRLTGTAPNPRLAVSSVCQCKSTDSKRGPIQGSAGGRVVEARVNVGRGGHRCSI